MTYYELIVYLDTISNEVRSEKVLDKLNNLNIYLKGDRYFRFIDHLSNLIQDRLDNAFYSLKSKILAKHMNIDEFSLELEDLVNEIEFNIKIANIKIVENENKEELIKSIYKSNNSMLDAIKPYFDDGIDSELIQNKIDSYYRG